LELTVIEAHPEGPPPPERIAEILSALPVPESVPPHGELHVDAEGNLWVQEWQIAPSEVQRYRVFDTEGHLLAALDIPERLRITDIGTDYILGVWTDGKGVEFIHLYALNRVH
jgi:hypothetical protein